MANSFPGDFVSNKGSETETEKVLAANKTKNPMLLEKLTSYFCRVFIQSFTN